MHKQKPDIILVYLRHSTDPHQTPVKELIDSSQTDSNNLSSLHTSQTLVKELLHTTQTKVFTVEDRPRQPPRDQELQTDREDIQTLKDVIQSLINSVNYVVSKLDNVGVTDGQTEDVVSGSMSTDGRNEHDDSVGLTEDQRPEERRLGEEQRAEVRRLGDMNEHLVEEKQFLQRQLVDTMADLVVKVDDLRRDNISQAQNQGHIHDMFTEMQNNMRIEFQQMKQQVSQDIQKNGRNSSTEAHEAKDDIAKVAAHMKELESNAVFYFRLVLVMFSILVVCLGVFVSSMNSHRTIILEQMDTQSNYISKETETSIDVIKTYVSETKSDLSNLIEQSQKALGTEVNKTVHETKNNLTNLITSSKKELVSEGIKIAHRTYTFDVSMHELLASRVKAGKTHSIRSSEPVYIQQWQVYIGGQVDFMADSVNVCLAQYTSRDDKSFSLTPVKRTFDFKLLCDSGTFIYGYGSDDSMLEGARFGLYGYFSLTFTLDRLREAGCLSQYRFNVQFVITV